MLEISLSQVEGLDSEHVLCSAVTRLTNSLAGARPAALLCFAGAHLDHDRLVHDLCANFPETPLAGCTTCGELSSDLGFSEDSLALLAFVSDSMQFASALGTGLGNGPENVAPQAVEACRKQLQRPISLCLAFPEGSSGMADSAVRELRKALGEDVPLFGGMAGHLVESPGPIRVFGVEGAAEDAVSLLCFAGPTSVSMAISHSWRPLGDPEPVTGARGPKLLRVGERSAQDFYKHYLGKHATPSSQFPLAVYPRTPHSHPMPEKEAASRPYYIRSPYDLGKRDGSIIFAGDVPAEALVSVTEATPERVLEDTRKVTAKMARKHEGAPSVALVFSCAARKDILGTRTRQELEILREHMPQGAPILGFYSFGEIGPVACGQASHLHNCTMLALLLGEKGYSPSYSLASPAPQEDICSCQLELSQESLEVLRQEIQFTKAKLKRSEASRARLEEARDMDTALLRTMNSELQHLTDELARSEEKYRRIVETTGQGFLLMDETFTIQYVNEAYCNLIGFAPEEITGKRPTQLMTEKYSHLGRELPKLAETSDYRRFTTGLQHNDGHEVPALVNANTLRNSQGDVLGHVAFVADLSEQKKALILAGKLQQSLMPSATPALSGLDMAGRSIACEEVGGDFFDYRTNEEHPDELVVTVADISGHGVDAALLMSAARAFLRMRATHEGDLQTIVSEMNQHLAQDLFNTGRFLTLLSVRLHPKARSFSCVRAGHDPPLVYIPATDTFSAPGETSLPLGVDSDTQYSESHIEDLPAGSILVLGTDGIWETENMEGEMFGKERLRGLIRTHATETASVLLERIF